MPSALMEELTGKGARFYPWARPAAYSCEIATDETLCRFVTSYATTDEQIMAFRALLA